MKKILRIIFSPLLNIFESGSEPFVYKPSHRIILIFIGCMFLAMAILVLVFLPDNEPAYLLPVVVFGAGGLLSLLIGLLGNERAVARIWNSRK